MKHTPGPWEFGDWGSGPITIRAKHPEYQPGTFAIIATTDHSNVNSQQQQANARLIAAAPEMKFACEAALTYLKLDKFLEKEQLIDFLMSVIAKTKGGG